MPRLVMLAVVIGGVLLANMIQRKLDESSGYGLSAVEEADPGADMQ